MRRLLDNEGKDAGTERVEPLIYGVGPSIDYRSRMNLKVKVLDFVQFGGYSFTRSYGRWAGAIVLP